MFKALLLGQWYNLSDAELEYSLKVRLDFIVFSRFTPNEGVPDESTICRFRNRLIDQKLLPKLLKVINSQLEANHLKIKESHGAVLDATIIESAARPRKVIENIDEDRNEQEESDEVIVEYSKDKDARWLKKGNKYHFGYKSYVTVDQEDGYIENIHVTAANSAEVKQLESSLKNLEKKKNRVLFADKAYTSKANREHLKDLEMIDGIMFKATKNAPLSPFEKAVNRWVSSYRFIVEQGFGTLKRKFKLAKTSYFGREKVEAQCYFKAICFNLLKAANKLA